MKKQILKIGKALSKAEQMQVQGGSNCFMDCHFTCLNLHPTDRVAYGDCRDACWAQC